MCLSVPSPAPISIGPSLIPFKPFSLRILSPTAPADRRVQTELRQQYFKFPANVINSQVKHAILWLYLKKSTSRRHNDTDAFIVLYKVVRNDTARNLFRVSSFTAQY